MPDIEITCVACNQPFPFSESEQAFYEERGFQQPKRCRQCRQSGRRAQRSGGGGGDRRGGGGGDRRGGGGGDRRGRGGGDRPRRGGPGRGRGAPRGRGGPPRRGGPGGGRRVLNHVGGRLTYTTHCAGCGAETEVPTPVGEAGRSAFCPECFAVRGRAWLGDDE